jgi:hypothetical protein
MYLTVAQAREFAERWLPAWTGNNPDHLVSFYTEDALYSDPTVPDGVRGRAALLAHFKRLLSRNPDWVWTQLEGLPLEGGFLNKWRAVIPIGSRSIEVVGVCLVQLAPDGRIRRNEVYFDRSAWIAEVAKDRDAPEPTAPRA